jgi:hypothetical protein
MKEYNFKCIKMPKNVYKVPKDYCDLLKKCRNKRFHRDDKECCECFRASIREIK